MLFFEELARLLGHPRVSLLLGCVTPTPLSDTSSALGRTNEGWSKLEEKYHKIQDL